MNLPDVANDNLSSFEKSLYGFLFRDSKKTIIISLIILAGFTSFLVGLRWDTGCLPIGDESGARDSIYMLEQGNRVASGQCPHVDFISPIGVLHYMLIHLGIIICGIKGMALTMGYLAFLPILFISTWIICIRRLRYIPSCFLTAATVAMLLGATALGNFIAFSSYETMYNRLGFALVSPLFVAAILPSKKSVSVADYLCVGILLCCAVFVKINFAIGGLMLLIIGLAMGNISLKNLPAIIIGFLAIMLVVAIYMHGNLAAFFCNTLILMKYSGTGIAAIAFRKIWYNIADVRLLLVLMSILIWIQAGRLKNINLSKMIKNTTVMIISIGIVFFIMLGCARIDGFMISYFLIFPIFSLTDDLYNNSPNWRSITIGLLGCICAGCFLMEQAQSVMAAARNSKLLNNSAREYIVLNNPSISDMKFMFEGKKVAENMNDAIELLQKNNVPKEPVAQFRRLTNLTSE